MELQTKLAAVEVSETPSPRTMMGGASPDAPTEHPPTMTGSTDGVTLTLHPARPGVQSGARTHAHVYIARLAVSFRVASVSDAFSGEGSEATLLGDVFLGMMINSPAGVMRQGPGHNRTVTVPSASNGATAFPNGTSSCV